MNTTSLTLAALPVLLSALGWTVADARTDPGTQGLVRIQPDKDQDESDVEFDRDRWKRDLLVRDLETREKHFDRFVDLARTNAQARAALEQWSKDESQPELSWTSRLALRELTRTNARGAWRGSDWNRLRARMEDLERHFGDMQWFFGDMQNGLDQLFQDRAWQGGRFPSVPPGSRSSAQSFNLQVGPDGVTCEVWEDVDGKQEKREYKAGSMEELLEANPELKDKIHIGGDSDSNWFAPGLNGRTFHFAPDDKRWHLAPSAPVDSVRTDILGIEFTKPAPDRVRDLGLEPEVGLNVERTEPGTIAHILGIKRGDLLIELNGIPLYGAPDVSKTLRERDAEAEVVVVLIDAKGQRRTLTWKPTPPRQDGDTSEQEEPRKF